MKLIWEDQNLIRGILSDGKTLVFNGKVWGRSSVRSTKEENLFGTINDFWETKDPNFINALENHYRKAAELFENTIDYRSLYEPISCIFVDLLNMHSWAELREWTVTQSNANLEIGSKDTIGSKDIEEMTYLTDDYIDVITLSILTKTVMPLWGSYFKFASHHLHQMTTYLSMIEMLSGADVYGYKPIIKLYNYVKGALKGTKFNALPITAPVSTEDVVPYLVSLVIGKRIMSFNPRKTNVPGEQEYSIVTNIHRVVRDNLNNLERLLPYDKVPPQSNDESDSQNTFDYFRASTSITDDLIVGTEYYLTDPFTIAKSIDNRSIRKHLNHAWTILNSPVEYSKDNVFEVSDIHMIIAMIILNDVISIVLLKVINREAILNAISICYCILMVRGYRSLAKLILATPAPIEDTLTTMSLSGNVMYNQISKEQYEVLANEYIDDGVKRDKGKDTSPGEALIRTFASEVSSRQWDIPNEDLKGVLLELYDLLLNTIRVKDRH